MYDLIIIGAGPGGYELALKASAEGLSTLLIEKDKLGGTCLNYGCIPTKTYYHAADVLRLFKTSNDYGISVDSKFDFSKAFQKKNKVVDELRSGIEFSFKKTDVTIVYGTASLSSHNTVVVNDTTYTATNIVIATGSSPIIFNLPGFDNKNVITSEELLELDKLPKSITILGAGVIGIEFASIFNEFGVDVTVIEMQDRILTNIDKEISRRLLAFLKNKGIKFLLSSKLEAVEKYKSALKISYSKDGVDSVIETEKLLVSVGRSPNVNDLGLESLGIEFSKLGIKVNENFQTNVKNIYAIGDVTGKMMLAHSATYSAYHVLKHIIDSNSKINFSAVPACVFTFPEVATIGLSEEECTNLDYKVSKSLFRSNGKATTINEKDGFIKVISVDDVIVGVHIIGPHASDLIHEALILINKKVTISEFSEYIHAHPTLSETLHLD